MVLARDEPSRRASSSLSLCQLSPPHAGQRGAQATFSLGGVKTSCSAACEHAPEHATPAQGRTQPRPMHRPLTLSGATPSSASHQLDAYLTAVESSGGSSSVQHRVTNAAPAPTRSLLPTVPVTAFRNVQRAAPPFIRAPPVALSAAASQLDRYEELLAECAEEFAIARPVKIVPSKQSKKPTLSSQTRQSDAAEQDESLAPVAEQKESVPDSRRPALASLNPAGQHRDHALTQRAEKKVGRRAHFAPDNALVSWSSQDMASDTTGGCSQCAASADQHHCKGVASGDDAPHTENGVDDVESTVSASAAAVQNANTLRRKLAAMRARARRPTTMEPMPSLGAEQDDLAA